MSLSVGSTFNFVITVDSRIIYHSLPCLRDSVITYNQLTKWECNKLLFEKSLYLHCISCLDFYKVWYPYFTMKIWREMMRTTHSFYSLWPGLKLKEGHQDQCLLCPLPWPLNVKAYLNLSSRRAYVRRHRKPSVLARGVSATPYGNMPIS